MSITITLPPEIADEATMYAKLNFRTVQKQIEYWCYLGKLADENPDLPLSFIKGALEGKAECERGEATPFEFRTQ
ncbi:MAG: hypothetical protein FWE93_05265 [Alphaproteobacteria bacterium]|nr:hypothetical protein [Alphaproteobacteria bacterium]